MAGRLVDGFDHYGASQATMKGWSASFDSTPTGRYSTSKAMATTTAVNKLLDATAGPSVFVQFGFMSNGTSTAVTLLQGFDGATCQFTVTFDYAASTFKVYAGTAGGTLLGSSSIQSMTTAVWHFIELNYVISNSAGAVTLRFNNVGVLTVTSADTQVTGNTSITKISVGGGGSSDYWDDLIVFDATGGAPSAFLGDRQVFTSFPISDGTHLDWIPSTGSVHYSTVDESTPNTSDGVSTSTVNDIDTYGVTALPAGATNPDIVQINVALSKNNSGSRQAGAVVRQSTTDAVSTGFDVPASEAIVSTLMSQNPITSSGWTVSTFNASQFGVKITA